MIKVTIEGTDRVVAQLNAINARQKVAVRESIGRLVLKLARKVKMEKLSGQVLKVRTGNLRRSIDTAVIDASNGAIGVVSTNVKYGRAHEYGFTGAVTIKAHLRKIKKVWGRSIPERSIMINSYTRNVNLPERSFLRSALAEFEPTVKRSLVLAINNAIRPQGGTE